MNLKKFFIGLAAAFSLVAVGTSVSQSNTAYAADQKIVVNKAKKQVEYPAVVNGTYFTQPTRHLCVYKNGSNGDKAVLRGEASEITFYNDLKKMKKELDYNEYGGAPIMGCSKPVFKIHGSAKASTVESALRLARDYAQSGIIAQIGEAVGKKS